MTEQTSNDSIGEIANDNLVLIVGKAASGKSASFMNIPDQAGVMYLNCESNKKLPFANKFMNATITDPYQVYQGFVEAEKMNHVHTIIVDSLTYLMDMFESMHVINSDNTMAAWGQYAQFFKNLMQQYVAKSTKNVILTAHTMDVLNKADMIMETMVKVKGSLMNYGIESAFSSVIGTKRMTVEELEPYQNDLLTIDEDDRLLGFKYVFQTRLTKETVNERIRNPIKMWAVKETYINNDIQSVIERLHQFYNKQKEV